MGELECWGRKGEKSDVGFVIVSFFCSFSFSFFPPFPVPLQEEDLSFIYLPPTLVGQIRR